MPADVRIRGIAFDTAVNAQIVAMPVAVVLAIGLVAPFGIPQQIGQSKTVMRCNKIHAAVGSPRSGFKSVARASQPHGPFAQAHLAVQPETTLGVAKAVVPLQPSRRKLPQLVTAFANVPGLGNQRAGRKERIVR